PWPRRDLAVVRDAAAGEVCVLRAEPHRIGERLRILQRTAQHLRIGERSIGMREGDASGLGQLAHLRDVLALEADRQRAHRIDVCLVERSRPVLEHFDQAGFVQRRVRVRRAGETGHAAGDRGVHFRFQRGHVLEPGLAQAGREIDQARADDAFGRVDDAVRSPACRRTADGGDSSGGDEQRRVAVDAMSRVDQASIPDLYIARGLFGRVGQLPASMLITAIRTAMPNVTCGRITEWAPSATAESISTPRFIGPGCMTIASGLASASFSIVRPYSLKYSPVDGSSAPFIRSFCSRSITTTSQPATPLCISLNTRTPVASTRVGTSVRGATTRMSGVPSVARPDTSERATREWRTSPTIAT